MYTRDEGENKISEFSERLNLSFNWFDSNFTKILYETFCEFWGIQAEVKLAGISENTNILAEGEEFFVTQVRLNTELSVFIRLSKSIVKSLLENTLGSNGKDFNIEKITELEAKILTGFDDFLYKNFGELIKNGEELPTNNNNYNEVNLTFFLKLNNKNAGKIVVKIPVIAVVPEVLQQTENSFSITDFLTSAAEVKLHAGYTRIRLNELKQLEKDDIVLLEHSDSSKMILTYKDFSTEIKVRPNPAIMVDCDSFEDNGNSPKGDNKMTNPDIYNMWDTIQVDIGAEFEKVKMSLGELKQISEGLVVDIGSVYDNQIDLKVEDKIVASGELIIINDRYGVKINKIFTEEKNQASENVQYNESNENLETDLPEDSEQEPYDENTYQNSVQTHDDTTVDDEDFDYSDFDVDEDDL